jgi:citrate synthase
MVGSSKASLFNSVSAGISALSGPLHGGANQEVIEMLERILADGGDYKKYIELAKDKSSGFRLMGFGHRVYKNFDPRAKILKKACDEVLGSARKDRLRCSTSPRSLEESGVERRILHRAQALPERGLLQRHHLPGHRAFRRTCLR